MPAFEAGKSYRTNDGRQGFIGYERDGWLYGDVDGVPIRWRATGKVARSLESGIDLVLPEPPRFPTAQEIAKQALERDASPPGLIDSDSRRLRDALSALCRIADIKEGV